ncbi:CASP-like protein 1F2 [Rutidosis leptorrhynchoides]|uniref:CASP-like protein 1F2 n=1 Tax=Rutidosis leptorrhynchoides TaxID=125765 RepID=UPI003A98F8BF
MTTISREPHHLTSERWNRFLKGAHVGLRILAHGFASISIVTMLTSNQDIYMMSNIVVAKAHFSYSTALRYKVIVDSLVGVFTLLSSILVYKKTKSAYIEPTHSFYFYLLLVDGVMMALAISGCAAATGVGFVALFGIEKPGISWSPICHMAKKFCVMATLSIAFSYSMFVCMAALTLISAFKLKLLAAP